jgi:cyclohexa-1,5-dienecarbonyl-CoA hydratase
LRRVLRRLGGGRRRDNRSGGRPHPVPGGPVGVVRTECPQPKTAEVEWDPGDRADHRQVELGADHERPDNGREKREALQGRAGIPVAEAGNDGKPRGSSRTERPVAFEPRRAVEDLTLDGLDAHLGAAARTEGRFVRHRLMAAWTRLHEASVLALPTVSEPASPSVPVTVRVQNGVARISLDRPPLNVLDIDTLRLLNAALRQSDRAAIRVVLLDSAVPRAFSAGVDVRDHATRRLDSMLNEVRENARLLMTLGPVTIAAIHGATLGGGAEIALLCDLVVAADDTCVGLPEVRLAAFPPVAAACLPERFGMAIAMLLLLGESLDAHAAQSAGLVGRVVPSAELPAAAAQLAMEVAANSAIALRALTAAARTSHATRLLERLDAAMEVYRTQIAPSRDADEGLRAFLEKRTPVWSHH